MAENLRLTSLGLEAVVVPDAEPTDLTLTAMGLEVVSTAILPEAPVLAASAEGTTLAIETSGFAHPREGAVHASTRYVVRLQGGGVLVDRVTDEDLTATFLTEDDGVPVESVVEVFAFHIDELGIESNSSNIVVVETGASTPKPITPTLTVLEVGLDWVRTSRTPFDHPEGVQDPPDPSEVEGEDEDLEDLLPWHLASAYEIREQGGAVVLETGMDPGLREAEQMWSDLGVDTAYEVRVQDMDGKYGTSSDWTPWVPFTTLAIPPVRPDTPVLNLDSCDPITAMFAVSFTYSHPESPSEGSAHARTRWLIGTRSDPAEAPAGINGLLVSSGPELLALSIDGLAPGTYAIAVEAEDELGRWSARSNFVFCDVPVSPPQPFFAQCLGAIAAEEEIAWLAFDDSEQWLYEGQISGDTGQTWQDWFSHQTSKSAVLNPDDPHLPNGTYVLRIRACDPGDISRCGEWGYTTVVVDRTGTVVVPYNFSELSEFPETWDLVGGPDVSAELVNELMMSEPPFAGILMRNHRKGYWRQGFLRFKELGQPDELDMQVQFSWVPRDNVGYGLRFSYAWAMQGGLAYLVATPEETGGAFNYHFTTAAGGSGIYPIAHPRGPCDDKDDWAECGCGFIGCATCTGGVFATAWWRHARPGRMHRYAIAAHRASFHQRASHPGTSAWHVYRGGAIEQDGPILRGAWYANRWDRASALCDAMPYALPRYMMRQRIRRESPTHVRVQMKMFGPGFSTAPEWHLNELVDTSQMDCGYCGLALNHLQGLTGDHGVLFHCATIVVLDEDVVDGPLLDQATLRETD